MLKMMAADNDDAYNLTPAFILETVAVAREFVRKSRGNVTTAKKYADGIDRLHPTRYKKLIICTFESCASRALGRVQCLSRADLKIPRVR